MLRLVFAGVGLIGEKRLLELSEHFHQDCSQVFNRVINILLNNQKYSKTVEISNKLFDNGTVIKMKNQINKQLAAVSRRGLEEGVFCGVSAGVSVMRRGHRHRGWFSGGMTRLDECGRNVERSTLFDLASLTKPLCTTLCTLHLIDQGLLQWDEPCLSWIKSCLEAEKSKISVRHLLQHSSGFPAYHPYYQQFSPQQKTTNSGDLLTTILNERLDYSPGTTCVYSDLGFILLGAIIEQQTTKRLDRLFKAEIAEPLELSEELHFLPLNEPLGVAKNEVAATEHCPWRGRVIQGEVHDEHSWLMGGIAGHAGLFGTVTAVLSLCECLLDVWKGRAFHPAFDDALLRRALTSKHARTSWCLGFDTPTPGDSSSGRYFSPQSVGHLGFSGTSFWIDPQQDIIMVLLTNRIHPSRENIRIRAFRPLFHNTLMETLHIAS